MHWATTSSALLDVKLLVGPVVRVWFIAGPMQPANATAANAPINIRMTVPCRKKEATLALWRLNTNHYRAKGLTLSKAALPAPGPLACDLAAGCTNAPGC